MKSKFKIKGLDCTNCALALERKLQKIEGIYDVTINFIAEKMNLEYDDSKKEDVIKNVKKVIKKEEPDITIEEI